MNHHKKRLLITLALALAVSLCLSAVASASHIGNAASVGAANGENAIIDRGIAWEMLNETAVRAEQLTAPGNDFSDSYCAALNNHLAAARKLLDSADSTTDSLNEMNHDLEYLIDEKNNPANHARFGCYTVAFTNNDNWSEPIYLYNWSDDGGEIKAWPGSEMIGGYVNEYGQKQYYAFVPMDVPMIVFSTNQVQSDDPNVGSLTVRVQTADIFVSGNTGYYLTGKGDILNKQVAEWTLEPPVYKTFDLNETDQPTEQPSQEPTDDPTDPDNTDQPVESYIVGDADGDGRVSIFDATTIQRKLAFFDVVMFNEIAADVNSGGLDIVDATMIQRWLAGLENALGIGKVHSKEDGIV